MKKIDWKERERILSGEELTEEEKQQFGMDYDEWKAMHDESRQELVESYRWGSWPMLFIAGFFLITSGIRNTKILMELGMGAGAGIVALAVASWVLGAVSIVVAVFMRKKSKELQRRKMEREQKEKEMREAEKMSESGTTDTQKTRRGTSASLADMANMVARFEAEEAEKEGLEKEKSERKPDKK